jgi:tellurium resistance protein TerD
MGVQLGKGTGAEASSRLRRALIGLGWQARSTRGEPFDLDLSIFALGTDGKVPSEDYFVFYHQLSSPCGAIVHSGDERVGDKEGDNESVAVDLDRVPAVIHRLCFVVTLYNGDALRQNFGQVPHTFVRVVDRDTGIEQARYDLSEDYVAETGMVFGELVRSGAEWRFKAVGQGVTGSLAALCRQYGVEVA